MARVLGHVFKPEATLVESELASNIAASPGVVRASSIPSVRWHELTFRSRNPLTQAEIDQAKLPGFTVPAHYDYIIWMAVSHHVLLCAESLAVVEAFAGRHLRRNGIHLRRTQIRVTELVRQLLATPTQFALTHVHARIGGFGESLKTISMWGDDLGDAQFVRDSSNIMFGTQCGLRRLDEERELLRLTNEGKFSFFYEEGRLKPIEGVLSYLYANSFFID
ncbi:MAG: hypothetical protein V4864_14675 [Pseudomonadota bacterium]